MKGFKEAYKSICHYYNEHESHMKIHFTSQTCIEFFFITNQSFMNILHSHKLVCLPWESGAKFMTCCKNLPVSIANRYSLGFVRVSFPKEVECNAEEYSIVIADNYENFQKYFTCWTWILITCLPISREWF